MQMQTIKPLPHLDQKIPYLTSNNFTSQFRLTLPSPVLAEFVTGRSLPTTSSLTDLYAYMRLRRSSHVLIKHCTSHTFRNLLLSLIQVCRKWFIVVDVVPSNLYHAMILCDCCLQSQIKILLQKRVSSTVMVLSNKS